MCVALTRHQVTKYIDMKRKIHTKDIKPFSLNVIKASCKFPILMCLLTTFECNKSILHGVTYSCCRFKNLFLNSYPTNYSFLNLNRFKIVLSFDLEIKPNFLTHIISNKNFTMQGAAMLLILFLCYT